MSRVLQTKKSAGAKLLDSCFAPAITGSQDEPALIA
jgi:hypothetical protein